MAEPLEAITPDSEKQPPTAAGPDEGTSWPEIRRLSTLLWIQKERGGSGLSATRPAGFEPRWTSYPFQDNGVSQPETQMSDRERFVATQRDLIQVFAGYAGTRTAVQVLGKGNFRDAEAHGRDPVSESFAVWEAFTLAPLIGDAPAWFQSEVRRLAVDGFEDGFLTARKAMGGSLMTSGTLPEFPIDGTEMGFPARIAALCHKAAFLDAWNHLGGSAALEELSTKYPHVVATAPSYIHFIHRTQQRNYVAGESRSDPALENLNAEQAEYEALSWAGQQFAAIGKVLFDLGNSVTVGKRTFSGSEWGLVVDPKGGSGPYTLAVGKPFEGTGPDLKLIRDVRLDLPDLLREVVAELDGLEEATASRASRLRNLETDSRIFGSNEGLPPVFQTWLNSPSVEPKDAESPAHRLLHRSEALRVRQSAIVAVVDQLAQRVSNNPYNAPDFEIGANTYGWDESIKLCLKKRSSLWSIRKNSATPVVDPDAIDTFLLDFPEIWRMRISEPALSDDLRTQRLEGLKEASDYVLDSSRTVDAVVLDEVADLAQDAVRRNIPLHGKLPTPAEQRPTKDIHPDFGF